MFAQYYKVICVAYLGETVKMCLNFFYILISINRYMLIGREHEPFLEKISKLDFKRTIFYTMTFSLLLNIGHLDQYEINYGNYFRSFEGDVQLYESYPEIVDLADPLCIISSIALCFKII